MSKRDAYKALWIQEISIIPVVGRLSSVVFAS